MATPVTLGLGLTAVAALSAAAWMGLARADAAGQTITYYVAADEVTWDYAPSGRDETTGQPFGEAQALWVETTPHRIGKVYQKGIYREYTDSTFTILKDRPAEWEHLGMLGPLMRGAVGDTFRVVFRNNVHFPASMHPHGVFYEKHSEGAPTADGTSGYDKADDAVPPGGTHTYIWPIPERAGPAAADLSSVMWMYHSHTAEMMDFNAGLVGPMLVTARDMTADDGTPVDVDRELIVSFHEVYEAESWYLEENMQTYLSDPDPLVVGKDPFGGPVVVHTGDPTFVPDYNLMESLNGLIYGNLHGLTMTEGERVRWYIMGTTNFEIHAPHWHGNTVTIGGMRTDVAQLLTMGMLIADMVPDNPGTWLFHCHVGPHLAAGMTSVYTVAPAGETTAR
jgi:hephaestin